MYKSTPILMNTLRFIDLLCTALCVHVQSIEQPASNTTCWSSKMVNNPLPQTSCVTVNTGVLSSTLATAIGQVVTIGVSTQTVYMTTGGGGARACKWLLPRAWAWNLVLVHRAAGNMAKLSCLDLSSRLAKRVLGTVKCVGTTMYCVL